MDSINGFMSPAEAWEELTARRRGYYAQYAAAFSGDHGELARTAAPGSFWKRGGKVKLHVPAAADIAATGASLLFGREPRYAIYDESLGDTEEGSQRRFTENSSTRPRPMRKLGMDTPTVAKEEITLSASRPRRMAASMPNGTPTSAAKATATAVCCRVGTI